MLTPEKIEELRGLLAKATPGPWKNHLVDDTTIVASNGFEIGTTWPGGSVYNGFVDPAEQHEINAALIVAMRNVMPELLDAAERADSMVDEIDMLRESEARWIGRLAVVRQITGDNGKMMLDEFAAWFDARWKSLIETESRASRAREDALREAAGIARNGWLIAPQSEQATMKERVAETATCDAIATAILALIDKPKGGDANDKSKERTRDPATSPGVTAGASTLEAAETHSAALAGALEEAKGVWKPISALWSKPAECGKGCPPRQVCDFCQRELFLGWNGDYVELWNTTNYYLCRERSEPHWKHMAEEAARLTHFMAFDMPDRAQSLSPGPDKGRGG